MDQLTMKKMAANAALQYVQADTIVGVGSGSTVNCFIEALGTIKHKIKGAVAASKTQKHCCVRKVLKCSVPMMFPVWIFMLTVMKLHRIK